MVTRAQKHTAEGAGTLKAHQRRGERQEADLPCELSVNKGWKGRRANSRQVISHCLK
jgi:hypothetical protein